MSATGELMQHKGTDTIRRGIQRLPFLMALVFGALWSVLYLTLGHMHAMWPMYDKEFPFFVPSLLGIQMESMSPFAGALFAFVDGALVAFTVAVLFVIVIRRLWR